MIPLCIRYRCHPSPSPDSSSVCLWCFPSITLYSQPTFKCRKDQVHGIIPLHQWLELYCYYNFTCHISLAKSDTYLGIWLDNRLFFKIHIQHLTQKLKINIINKKAGFLYRIKECLSSSNYKTIVQSTFMSVLQYIWYSVLSCCSITMSAVKSIVSQCITLDHKWEISYSSQFSVSQSSIDLITANSFSIHKARLFQTSASKLTSLLSFKSNIYPSFTQ